MTAVCVAGDPRCCGITGVFFGELPCHACWQAAPQLAVDIRTGAV